MSEERRRRGALFLVGIMVGAMWAGLVSSCGSSAEGSHLGTIEEPVEEVVWFQPPENCGIVPGGFGGDPVKHKACLGAVESCYIACRLKNAGIKDAELKLCPGVAQHAYDVKKEDEWLAVFGGGATSGVTAGAATVVAGAVTISTGGIALVAGGAVGGGLYLAIESRAQRAKQNALNSCKSDLAKGARGAATTCDSAQSAGVGICNNSFNTQRMCSDASTP